MVEEYKVDQDMGAWADRTIPASGGNYSNSNFAMPVSQPNAKPEADAANPEPAPSGGASHE